MKSRNLLLLMAFLALSESPGWCSDDPIEYPHQFITGEVSHVTLVEGCECVLQMRNDFVTDQLRTNWPKYVGLGDVPTRKFRFVVPALCDLLCVESSSNLTIQGAYYLTYVGESYINQYGMVAIPYLADVYVDPRIASSAVATTKQLGQRRDVALYLLFDVSTPATGRFDEKLMMRKQGQVYASYARRMRALIGRVWATTVNFTVPTLGKGALEQRTRRACEILLALEGVTNKPLAPAEEAVLLTELCTLHPPYSAQMLVSYLDKPLIGLDNSQLKGALVAIGDEATREVLRFLRADERTPEALQEGLSLLGALCKSPEATKACFLQAAKVDEEVAKRFTDFAMAPP